MLSSSSDKLVELGSAPIGPPLSQPMDCNEDLGKFLEKKNGFFVFESALHIFPYDDQRRNLDFKRVNDPNVAWKRHFWHDFSRTEFFAADLFGGLFGFMEEKIIYFEPETGDIKSKARNLEDWCDLILLKYKVETGWPLAHAWQEANSPIQEGNRLIPKIFFVFGGKYELGNLYEENLYKSLSLRGDIARQIRDIPDKKSVKLETKY